MNQLKSLFTVCSVVTMALFIFAYCTDDKQSELSLESFEQFVTISGKVVYSTGIDTTSTDYVMEIMKPAVGRKVFVEINYADYNPAAVGVKTYETVIDSVGAFSIEVPTTPTGITANIRMEEFTDFFSEYVKMEDGKPVFKTRLRRYDVTFPALPALKPGAFSFPNILTYNSTEIDMEGYDERITLTGNVQLAYEASYRTGAYKPASSGTVELEVVYDPLGAALTVTYGTATDAAGNYSITLPLKSFKEGLQIKTVSVKGIGQTAYTHYHKPNESKTLSGAYLTTNASGFPVTLTNIIENIPHSLGQQFLKFTPNYNNGLPAESAPESWTDNLAGWEKYDGFNETVTVTGTCNLAVETAFAVGSYNTGVRTLKLNVVYGGTIPNKTVYAATETDGSFSINLPAEKATDTYTVAVLAPEETEFLHYKSAAESVTLRGTYALYKNIKKDAPQWNELGDYYYKFTPASSPATWHDDLAGWVKIKDHNLFATVAGKVYLAKETSFATGGYDPASNQVIGINAGGNTYEALVGNDGILSIDVLVENNGDELPVTLNTTTISGIKNFVHFTTGGTDDTRILSGNYTSTQLKSATAKWNELGDIYYKFTPTAPPATWQANIAGWQVRLDHQFSANITGVLKIPVETAFRTGAYIGASYQTVTVVSNGFTLVGATNADGLFSIPVPLKYTDEEPATTWGASMNAVSTSSFSHFRRPTNTTTEVLSGDYTVKLTHVPAGAAWNQLGTRYYDFTPTGSPTNWSNRLPGWVVVPNNTATITIKGKAKKAVQVKEGGVWIAGWEADKNRLVTVRVSGEDYDVTSNSAGDIIFMLPVISVPASQTISIDPENDVTDVAFIHHADISKDDNVPVYGKFVNAGNISSKVITKDANANLYEVTESAKMYFTPTVTPDGWSSYSWASIVNND